MTHYSLDLAVLAPAYYVRDAFFKLGRTLDESTGRGKAGTLLAHP
jgi:hypothetical protein